MFIFLCVLIALIHLPPIQKKITRNVTNYLSSKMETRVEIGRISFSVKAHVLINDLGLWDREGNKILSVREVEVNSGLLNLMQGKIIFDRVRITGLDGTLKEDDEGLNIQFIVNAFSSDKATTTEPQPVVLQFRSVELEDITFGYASAVNGITVTTRLEKLTVDTAQYASHPNTIKAGKVLLQHAVVNILSLDQEQVADASVGLDTITLTSDYSRSGITMAVDDLQIAASDFSFHRNEVTTTPKFDSDHIEVNDMQLQLRSSLYSLDTLTTVVQEMSARLPGFQLDHLGAEVRMNPNRLEVSRLNVLSGMNEVKADLAGWYAIDSTKSIENLNGKIKADVQIHPKDIAYFLSDSVMNYFNNWDSTTLIAEGSYITGKGEISQLMLQSGNSRLQAQGIIHDAWNKDKINWKDIEISASVDAAFTSMLTPFLNTLNLPSQLSVQLASSGSIKEASVNGKIISPWGNLLVNGLVSQPPGNVGFNLTLTGEHLDAGKWMDLPWIGPVDLVVKAKGKAGDDTDMMIDGTINSVVLLDEPITAIELNSSVRKSEAIIEVYIDDPEYRSVFHSQLSFADTVKLTNTIQFDGFSLGKLLKLDSTLSIKGITQSTLTIDDDILEGSLAGNKLLFKSDLQEFFIDSLTFKAALSPSASTIRYYSDYGTLQLESNFDIREATDAVKSWSQNILPGSEGTSQKSNRTASVTVALERANLFQLLGVDVDEFSSLILRGDFNEQEQTVSLNASSEKFKGYGVSLDTLTSTLIMLRDSAIVQVNADNILYGSVQLGDLSGSLRKKGKAASTGLLLTTDSLTLLNWQAHLVNADSGLFVYTDSLRTFDHAFTLDPENAVFIGQDNVVMNKVNLSRDSVLISMNGDLNAFDVKLKNLDLTKLDILLFPDTTVISRGYLNAALSYIRNQQVNLSARVDSLSLYTSSPITVTATAVSDENEVPFEFLLTSTTNTVDLKGNYFFDKSEVDASLHVDVNELSLFDFMVSGFIENVDGSLKGEATITGPVQQPQVNGYLQLLNVGLTTVNPRLTFFIKDDKITLANSALFFDDFKLYDPDQNPLVINGQISSPDYQAYVYDLHITSDNYTLINNPDSVKTQVHGLLVLDSDIRLKGDEKDTDVQARLKIKDATTLRFVTASEDIELLKAEGIIDFVEPSLLRDSLALEQSLSYYDSLIASLPAFNMSSSITVEDKATIRIIIDEQSGDYLEASGGAALELGYDRTGNLSLSGNYTIRKGMYRLSFYDLVKKNFNLVEGSSVTWNGSPQNGDLNIKAVHTVESNSLGLIGHEIGENEKSTYKRSLNYEVGININGTIERPVISFSLDLPANDKASYPVLANKLDRLRQPEYESELNKQVFGLLVLGGFLPESSGSDFNSSLVATTALSNSVNSLLASQLNKFANQYIKGFNIDVGIQSYSDYSAPGGKTQTAMDFRVSKRIMDDRLSFEIGGDFDINADQSGANTGTKNYRGDVAIIYDLTGNGDKQLKLFNNETYDIVYQEIRNTGISLIFIREFSREEKKNRKQR